MNDDARTISPATVDAYWASGIQVTVPLPGSPECRVAFDPLHGRMSLLTPLSGKEPDVASLRNLSFGTTVDGDVVWGELSVEAGESHQAAFAMITAIADRLQLDGDSLALAVPSAVETYKRLLARRQGLNDEQQRGLVGELFVLQHLIAEEGAKAAIEAWHGPLAEEHDFFFASQHFEVKTTSGEKRRHVIGNTSQLTQSGGTELWLVSVQITAGVEGAGTSLPELVRSVRAAAGDERPEFDRRIATMGWRPTDIDLYPMMWQYRTQPRAYLVAGDFPRITEELINDRIPSWALVSDVSYRIDLTHFPHPSTPAVLAGFVETQEPPV